jgi:hypothetical protein
MMNRRYFVKAGLTASAAPLLFPRRGVTQTLGAAPALPAAGSDGWVSLLNGRDLTGWYSMLETSGKDVAQQRKMVLMEEEMLHINGNEDTGAAAEAGYLATHQEFENVRIRVEYKWGVKRFSPSSLGKRDNGILYGLVGQDKVWPTCIECQIEESDVGDYFLVNGVRGTQVRHLDGLFPEGVGRDGWSGSAARKPLPPAGPPDGPGTDRKIKDGNFENLNDWNVVEVIWQGNRSAHIVNGRVVNMIDNLEQPDPHNPGQFIPLTRGKIAIELEYAEIWFRRIEVKPLPANS